MELVMRKWRGIIEGLRGRAVPAAAPGIF
jgi:hypothetical protein